MSDILEVSRISNPSTKPEFIKREVSCPERTALPKCKDIARLMNLLGSVLVGLPQLFIVIDVDMLDKMP